MSAGVAVAPRTQRRTRPRDPALIAATVAVLALTFIFLAPRPAVSPAPPALSLAVADLRGHALVVADTDDPGRTRRISLPGGPHELLRLPGGRVVASLEQFGTLAVVDIASGEVQTLSVGGTPHGLAIQGDTLYVTDRSVSAIRRFAIGTWEERAPLASGAWPHIVLSRSDGTLAVANAADDTLTLGDHAVPVSHVPESVAVAPDGRVATAGSIGGTLHVFTAQGTPIVTSDLGGRPVRLLFNPSGRVLAAALSADGAIALVDGGPMEGGRVRRVAVGGVPDGLAFSPDGRWLFVGDMLGGTVSVVEVARARVVDRFVAGQTAGALLVLPTP